MPAAMKTMKAMNTAMKAMKTMKTVTSMKAMKSMKTMKSMKAMKAAKSMTMKDMTNMTTAMFKKRYKDAPLIFITKHGAMGMHSLARVMIQLGGIYHCRFEHGEHEKVELMREEFEFVNTGEPYGFPSFLE